MRLLVAVSALAAVLAFPAATSANHAKPGQRPDAYPLTVGDHGKRVRDAQWLLMGKKPQRIKVGDGKVVQIRSMNPALSRPTGRYGPMTANAVRQMKYRLGYRSDQIDGIYGQNLHRLLLGRIVLPKAYVQRMNARSHSDRGRGVVRQLASCAGSRSPKAHVLAFWREVSALYGAPLVCTSGFRPGSIVAGTNRLSDHGLGMAADIATPTNAMNYKVARAALVVAGMRPAAAARVNHPSQYGWRYNRVNIVFGCHCFGNHWNHVHAGLYSWRGQR